MQPTVIFRDFEERDIDFIYKCKNDEELNSLIVGHYHPFTYEEATKWVRGCMGEHETYKFWAVCTNDEEKRIVGWTAISDINQQDKSASLHSVVIGDKMFKNGMAYIACYLHVIDYAFRVLKFNRLLATYLAIHKAPSIYNQALYFQKEGIQRAAHYKSGVFIDVIQTSMLYNEYREHYDKGDFEINKIIRRLIQIIKQDKIK